MEMTRDVYLRGAAWKQASDKLSTIFKKRPHYMLYMLSMSIGIMYDRRIEKLPDNGEETISIPRNVFVNNDNGKLGFMFQAAVLSTMTEDFDEDYRLSLAFGEVEYDKLSFLTSFANFGITKLVELIGESDLESMENIRNFLVSTVEGKNYDLYDLPDDLMLDVDL